MSDEDRFYLLWLNPEPWTVGEISGRRIAPDPNLQAYQAAVREELDGAEKLEGQLEVTFFFWRQKARYIDTNDRVRQRNQADATNMQKALEDACQGVLFDNDREVRHIESWIIEQTPHTEPRIVIWVRPYRSVPEWIINEINHNDLMYQASLGFRPSRPVKNSWPPRRD